MSLVLFKLHYFSLFLFFTVEGVYSTRKSLLYLQSADSTLVGVWVYCFLQFGSPEGFEGCFGSYRDINGKCVLTQTKINLQICLSLT